MTTATLIYTGSLVVTFCWCGTGVGIPSSLYNEAAKTGKAVYCPVGHTFTYADTENDRLKRDLKWANNRAAAERAARDQAEASLRATKGHVTRLRRKVLVGECPFCGQHLRDLERHVTRQHPGENAETFDVTT